MAWLLLLLSHVLPAMQAPASQPKEVVVPAVHFRYADPPGPDVFNYENPIQVELDYNDLKLFTHPVVRLFASRYAADAGDPLVLAAQKVKGCAYFPWRRISYKPTTAIPQIVLGRLPDTDFRCVGNRLQPTDFYLVIEEGGQTNSVIRIDLDHVDEYFEHAYWFRVKVPRNHPCNTGTDTVDQQEARLRREHPRRYLAARRQSKIEQAKLAPVDVKVTCIELVKQPDTAYRWLDQRPPLVAESRPRIGPSLDR